MIFNRIKKLFYSNLKIIFNFDLKNTDKYLCNIKQFTYICNIKSIKYHYAIIYN